MTDAREEIDAGDRFAFGENWQRFLELMDDDRIEGARHALADFLGTDDLTGKTFVDIGSGSGLSSLAARRMGASVVSFDFDSESVACTQELRRRYDSEDQWRVEQGSALDKSYMSSLGQFDVVYSWGVLHHTGDLWTALDGVTSLCRSGGLLFVALYNDQGMVSQFWTAVKRRYNQSGPRGRQVILSTVGGFLNARAVAVAKVKRRPLRRGMDRRRDVLDWIGGWPFEVSTPRQVIDFYGQRGFELVKEKTVGRRMGNNEFLFKRG